MGVSSASLQALIRSEQDNRAIARDMGNGAIRNRQCSRKAMTCDRMKLAAG